MIFNSLVFLATLIGMEGFAFLAHKYVMHGWGWGWHRSHHEPRTGWFEKNDLYAVVFAGVAIVLVEQNVMLALEIAQRAVVVRSGEVVFDGPASRLAEDDDLWSLF